jgi:bifunctional DNA-binding transcriptional regulator/antitoxin component of YhaV-PrlF toxin-antitoxin module|tara:strand:+ start:1331 stop:1495 length:165 start_codon:yes stop_codon:yes gene_type:complete
MKILREKSRVYNGKPYYKYKINIPEEILKEAKFKVGDELRVEVMEGIVKLKKVK